MKPGTVAQLTLPGGKTLRALCVLGDGELYWVCENSNSYDLHEPGVKVDTLTVFDLQKFSTMPIDELDGIASMLAGFVKKNQNIWGTVCDLLKTVIEDPDSAPAPRFKEPGVGGIVKCNGWVYMKHMDGYWYNQQTDETHVWSDIVDDVDEVVSEGVHTV